MVHSNLTFLCTALKNERQTSPDLAMNRLSIVNFPVSDWSSFRFRGGFMSGMVLELEGWISIPCTEIMKPKNLPPARLKFFSWDSSSC
jgi:hypothetical protein